MANSQFVWLGSSGCLLPFLIVFNFLFGIFIFNSVLVWLSVEAILVLLFILNLNIMTRKINQKFNPYGYPQDSVSPNHKSNFRSKGRVIDVQGEEVEEDKRLE
jgi:hypothetical protein